MLEEGDLVIDGGNSKFTEDAVHAEFLAEEKIKFIDCGVSGGVWGLENGYGLMCGGDAADVKRVMPVFDALRPEGPRDEGFVHVGEVGSGHYAKMVHNGIEYAHHAGVGRGLRTAQLAADLIKDVTGTFKAWERGTVVRSWLLELLVRALEEDPKFADIEGYVDDSGEGRWTVAGSTQQRGSGADDQRGHLCALRVAPGRPVAVDEGRRSAAQPVRRARRSQKLNSAHKN